MFNKQFTSLFSGASQNGIGTFASVGTDDGVFSFSYNKIQENSILGIHMKGGSSDGLTNIFTNSKLNTNVGLGLSYHLLNNKVFIRTIRTIKQIADETNSIKSSGFSFGWFSFGYSFKYDTFRLYDKLLDFDEQIKRVNYLSHELSVGYSHYKKLENDDWKSYYFSLGAIIKYKNNIENLSRIEVSDITSIVSEDTERQIIKKYNAFVGEYKENINEAILFFDFYYFIYDNNYGAIHILPKVKFAEETKPIWNFDIGYLVPFKSKDKSNINVEFFYQLVDISNTLNITNGVFKRNNVGLRITLPINF